MKASIVHGLLLLALALALAPAAQAQVVGSLGGGGGTFLELTTTSSAGDCQTSATCALGGYTIDVGQVVAGTSSAFSPLPAGAPVPDAYLSAGNAAGTGARVDFTTGFETGGLTYVSFLWGRPNAYSSAAYDVVEVFTGHGAVSLFDTSAASLNFPSSPLAGDAPRFVQFRATGDSLIEALGFYSRDPGSAFEVSDFNVMPTVAEPDSAVLMLAGIGVLAAAARRRRRG